MLNKKVLFGTAGIPSNSKKQTSENGVFSVKDNGLDAMELEFVRSVRLKEKSALKIKEASQKNNIKLSCHSPYYINFNSKEQEKIEASIERIYRSAYILNVAGGNNVVFHTGFFHDMNRELVLEKCVKNIKRLRDLLDENDMEHIILRPELTGKESQIGSEHDLKHICSNVRNTLPCIDISHYFARYRGAKSWEELFSFLNEEIPTFLKNAHCHLSGIEYTDKGEKKHLNLLESDFDYKEIIQKMIKYDMQGTVICESPSLEKDAILMKEEYTKLLKQG